MHFSGGTNAALPWQAHTVNILTLPGVEYSKGCNADIRSLGEADLARIGVKTHHFLARSLYAFLISSWLAFLSTPRTAEWIALQSSYLQWLCRMARHERPPLVLSYRRISSHQRTRVWISDFRLNCYTAAQQDSQAEKGYEEAAEASVLHHGLRSPSHEQRDELILTIQNSCECERDKQRSLATLTPLVSANSAP